MAVKCQEIIRVIETMAPRKLAEEWDNVGLHIGEPAAMVNRVLVTLDVDADVVREAIERKAQMIVAHHPFFYKPVRNIRFDQPAGAMVKALIANEIAVYCAHTNLDSAAGGVNDTLANALGLTELSVLNPDKGETLYKITVFVPAGYEDQVREAVSRAGAGWIGNYSDCAFQTAGTGTFRALEGADPFSGKVGELEKAEEFRLETIAPESGLSRVIDAMLEAHPYEEVAYDVYQLVNKGRELGLGRVGRLPAQLSFADFCRQVKKALNLAQIKIGGPLGRPVHKIAVCGGSGASLLAQTAASGADVLVTGDLKYHEAQQALAMGLNFIDAGHFGTEYVVVAQVADLLRKFAETAETGLEVLVSEVNTDPFAYF